VWMAKALRLRGSSFGIVLFGGLVAASVSSGSLDKPAAQARQTRVAGTCRLACHEGRLVVLLVLINILVIVVVGPILFYLIDRFVRDDNSSCRAPVAIATSTTSATIPGQHMRMLAKSFLR
jgi:hypothetical protein